MFFLQKWDDKLSERNLPSEYIVQRLLVTELVDYKSVIAVQFVPDIEIYLLCIL